jgi:hypothetical protein
MIRTIIIILIFLYHKEIYNFLISKNITSISSITNEIKKKNKKFENFIQEGNIKETLKEIKKIDNNKYKECKIILNNIRIIRNSLIKKKKNFKYQYDNIKLERKKIMNILTSLVTSHGFLENHKLLIEDVDSYIKKILNELIEKKNNYKSTEWFEETELGEDNTFGVEANDDNINYNYDIY